MPQIQEITSFTHHNDELMDDSGQHDTSTSLQVSTTSPENPPQRASHVRKSNCKSSRESSSRSSSASSRPPTGLQGRSHTHRGPGFSPVLGASDSASGSQSDQPSGSFLQQVDPSQYVQQNVYDQRSINVDQRQLHVGITPEVMSQANAVVSAAREQVYQIQSQAQTEVSQAQMQLQAMVHHAESIVHEVQSKAQSEIASVQSQAQASVRKAHSIAHSVESQASGLMSQLEERHRREMEEVQIVAQRVHDDYQSSQHQLGLAQDRVNELLGIVSNQADQLEHQRKEHTGLTQMVLDLQHQVTLLRQSTSTPPAQDQNATVIDMSPIMREVQSLRNELSLMKQAPSLSYPAHPMAKPASPAQSACAGFPHPTPVFPIHKTSGPDFWSISTPTQPPQPPGSDPSGSSSSEDGRRGGGFPGGNSPGGGTPGGGPPPGGFSPYGGNSPGQRSQGVGSTMINDESQIYKAKDLSLVKIETLPADAAQYRGWRNSFLTKASSIDKTGQNRILQWLLQAFTPDTTREMLQATSAEMPRLDAHLASLLMDPRHLRGELGLTFQAYAESEQMQGRVPLGRILLNMIAKRFFLDQNRGANLTQQSLLELDLNNFSHDGLRVFVDRVGYVLNSIPAELQPSEMTKYTWLYSRMKKVRVMQRHVDRIRDSRPGSHVRSFHWLFEKLRACIHEMREDTNEESIRKSLQLNDSKGAGKDKPKPKAAVVVPDAESQTALPVNPKSKAQPKAKDNSKGAKGKGKGDNQPKGGNPPPKQPKATPAGPPPKAKAEGSREKSKVPCLFYPKGTCNRGASCPFSHEAAPAKAKPKAEAKGPAAAKATVATLIATSASQGANAVKTNTSFVAETLRLACLPFKFALTMLTAVSNLVMPFGQRSSDGDCLHISATSSSNGSLGLPVVVQRTSESACLATSSWNSGTTTLEWIADSGASRSLCSIRALQDQGLSGDVIQHSLQSADTLRFETGNGTTDSNHIISIHGHQFGTHDHRVLDDCPIARRFG